MNMTEKWEQLPDDEKKFHIVKGLIEVELQVADPVFSHNFTEAKARTTDPADRMRLDIQLSERVTALRQEGRMLPVEELHTKAEEMVDMGSDEMRGAFSEFSQELRQRS